MDEAKWRKSQDSWHDLIRNSTDDEAADIINSIQREITNNDFAEAEAFYNFSKHGNPYNASRHTVKGVPHAYSSEEVALKALQASGIDARRDQRGHTGTDLMIGDREKLMDVQGRFTGLGRDDHTMAVFNNLRDNSGIEIYERSNPNATLGEIFDEIEDQNRYARRDKLMQRSSNTDSSRIKDLIIGGSIPANQVRNLTSERDIKDKHHGFYDPTAPNSLDVIDYQVLHDTLRGMKRREFRDLGGQILKPGRFAGRDLKNKLKLKLPQSEVLQLAKPEIQYISDDVNQILLESARRRMNAS